MLEATKFNNVSSPRNVGGLKIIKVRSASAAPVKDKNIDASEELTPLTLKKRPGLRKLNSQIKN